MKYGNQRKRDITIYRKQVIDYKFPTYISIANNFYHPRLQICKTAIIFET